MKEHLDRLADREKRPCVALALARALGIIGILAAAVTAAVTAAVAAAVTAALEARGIPFLALSNAAATVPGVLAAADAVGSAKKFLTSMGVFASILPRSHDTLGL